LIWVATLKDGTIIRQDDGIKLDKSKVERFRITESSGDSIIHFNADNGVVRFSNLDYRKVCGMVGGEEIKLIFDKENEVFKLDKNSLEFMKNIILREEKHYFYIEFDQTGKFFIEGKPFYMAIRTNGKEYTFTDYPPYNEFDYTISAFDDFLVNSNSILKKTHCKSKFMISYTKEYSFDIGNFEVKHSVALDILKGMVLHESIIKSDNSITCEVITYFGDTREALLVNFNRNSSLRFNKALTLV